MPAAETAQGEPAARQSAASTLDWDGAMGLRRRVAKTEQLCQDSGTHWRGALDDLAKLLHQWSGGGSGSGHRPATAPAEQRPGSHGRPPPEPAGREEEDAGDLSPAQLMMQQPLPDRPETSHGRGQTRDAMRPPMVAIDERDPELEVRRAYARGACSARPLPQARLALRA